VVDAQCKFRDTSKFEIQPILSANSVLSRYRHMVGDKVAASGSVGGGQLRH
jgi:hypothetical protein